MRYFFCFSIIFFISLTSFSQNSYVNYNDSENFELYNKLCPHLGGDSVRCCNGLKCVGQVRDYFTDGKLKHNGYYDQGKIVSVFTNYYRNGNIERSFIAKSESRGNIKEFYTDGKMKSQGQYLNGEMLKWEDYFENGFLEFSEEYNKSIEYHLYTHIYYEDGTPKILFDLINEKQRLYSYKEYYSNGKIEEEGNKIQNKSTHDYQQDGTWNYYDESGKLILKEEYINGMLNNETKYQ